MKIAQVEPKPPPPVFSMQFSNDEGWALVAALRNYVALHPKAADRENWICWASELDSLLRAES